MEQSCSFHGFNCDFSKIIGTPPSKRDSYFQEAQFDEEQVDYLRAQILNISNVSMGILLPDAELFHSSSSSQSWWKASFPNSQSAGGVFFSTIPQLSIWGGKAPLGVTLKYRTKENSLPILHLPARSLLLDILIELSGEGELEDPEAERKLVGDDIIPLLNQLGFWGYYSCEECEIYLSNSAISKILEMKPLIWEDRRIGSSYSIRSN